MTINYSKCVHCCFEKITAIDVEDLNDGLKKLMVKENYVIFPSKTLIKD